MPVYRRKIRGKRSKVYTAKFVYNGRPHRRGKFPDKDTAQHWIDTTRAALRRGEVGYVKVRRASQVDPLISDFADHLRALRRSDKYAEVTESRLRRFTSEAGIITLSDLTDTAFEKWRASKPRFQDKPIKPRTINQFLNHLQEFCGWLVSPMKLLAVNPLASVASMSAIHNESYRRAGTIEELTKLLETAPPDRSVVYRFLIYIPLRRGAMKAIVWSDFNFEGERPTFTLRPELNKGKHAVKMAIRQDLAVALKQHRGEAMGDDQVFEFIPKIATLKRDLKNAGIAFDDGKGNRRLDLHAFRKTVVRLLKRAGVSFDEIHVFLQHRDRRTTERHYDDDLVQPEIMTAAEKMPSIVVGAHLDAQNRNLTTGSEK